MKEKLLLTATAILMTAFCAGGLAACKPSDEETAHEHQMQHFDAIAATCTEEGNSEYWVCRTCGKYFSDAEGKEEIANKSSTVISAIGHSWGEWVTKEPTCTEDGYKECECSLCHEPKRETIKATGHTFSKDWSYDETYHWHAASCEHSDQVSDKAEHAFADGICSVCDARKISAGLTYSLNNDGVSYSVTGIGTCTDADIAVPSAYNGLPVTAIGDSAFFNCSSLVSVNIPDSVTSIGKYALGYCASLTSVNIPDSVTSIGSGAFYYCTSLTGINIPERVTSIGSSAFRNCDLLTSITIPESVTIIGEYAFSGCRALTSVTFEITDGWWVSTSSEATSGTDISSSDLEDPATAVNYLTSDYGNCYWKRG